MSLLESYCPFVFNTEERHCLKKRTNPLEGRAFTGHRVIDAENQANGKNYLNIKEMFALIFSIIALICSTLDHEIAFKNRQRS